jgi:hypothetical protein
MMFFRSEEMLDQWLVSHHAERGAVLSIQKLLELSQSWYGPRMSPDFHGRTLDQAREIFRSAGLTSEYWQGT